MFSNIGDSAASDSHSRGRVASTKEDNGRYANLAASSPTTNDNDAAFGAFLHQPSGSLVPSEGGASTHSAPGVTSKRSFFAASRSSLPRSRKADQKKCKTVAASGVEHRILSIVFDSMVEGCADKLNLEQLDSALSQLGWQLDQGDIVALVLEVQQKGMEESRSVSGDLYVNFDEFCQCVVLVQNAVRFDAFDERPQDATEHLELAVKTKNLLPDGARRWYWSVLVAVTTCYVFFAVGFQLVDTDSSTCRITLGPDIVASIILAIDIVVNLLTIYVKSDAWHKVIVDDRKALIKHNVCAIGFIIDVFAALPLFTVACHGSELKFISVVRGVKIFGLNKMFTRVTALSPINRAHIYKYFGLSPIILGAVHSLCLVHATAVGFILFNPSQRTYASALYQALYFFSTVGLGDISPISDGERWYMAVVVIIAMLVNAIVIGSAIDFIQRGDMDSNRKKRMLQLDAVLEFFELPEGLANEVRQMQNYLSFNNIVETNEELVAQLPADIKANLTLFERIRAISLVPFFADTNAGVRLGIAQLLLAISYAPEEPIITFGEIGAEMYFLTYGFVDVFSGAGAYLATLKEGSYFGEVALLSTHSKKRQATIRSLTYCFMFVLRGDDFEALVDKFPKFRAKLEVTARNRMKANERRVSLQRRQSTTDAGDSTEADTTTLDFDEGSIRRVVSTCISRQLSLSSGQSGRSFAFSVQSGPNTRRSSAVSIEVPFEDMAALETSSFRTHGLHQTPSSVQSDWNSSQFLAIPQLKRKKSILTERAYQQQQLRRRSSVKNFGAHNLDVDPTDLYTLRLRQAMNTARTSPTSTRSSQAHLSTPRRRGLEDDLSRLPQPELVKLAAQSLKDVDELLEMLLGATGESPPASEPHSPVSKPVSKSSSKIVPTVTAPQQRPPEVRITHEESMDDFSDEDERSYSIVLSDSTGGQPLVISSPKGIDRRLLVHQVTSYQAPPISATTSEQEEGEGEASEPKVTVSIGDSSPMDDTAISPTDAAPPCVAPLPATTVVHDASASASESNSRRESVASSNYAYLTRRRSSTQFPDLEIAPPED